LPTLRSDGKRDFRTVLEEIAYGKGSLITVFSDYACMAACAYAMQTREKEYLSVAGRYSREELERFAKAMAFMVEEMEQKPFEDLLGAYQCDVQSKLSRDLGGEFYTPGAIGELMAKVGADVLEAVNRGRPVSINDPASGSGGLILSLAQEFAKAQAVDLMRVTCQDISKIACDMAYINTTLWGVPARIIWGDTLRRTVEAKWENIHWHRVGEPMRERLSDIMDMESSDPAEGVTPTEDPPECDTDQRGQIEWRFD